MKTVNLNKKPTFICCLLCILTLSGCGSQVKPERDEFLVLEQQIQSLLHSPVADAAPLEMKFIQQKMELARQAGANKKRKLEATYLAEVKADIKVAQLRTELNQLNDQLLDKREKVSAAEVYLLDLKEQLK